MIRVDVDRKRSTKDTTVVRVDVDFYCSEQACCEIRLLIRDLLTHPDKNLEYLGYINEELDNIRHIMEVKRNGKNCTGDESN